MSQDGWLWLHISFFILGVAGLATAVVSAGIYLWQSAELKSKHPGRAFFKLPSLDKLDKIHEVALGWGLVLFTLGILSGVFWAQRFQGVGCIFKDPKVLLSFITCFFYWLIFSFRLFTLRRGHKIAIGTLLSTVLLVLTFVSSHYLATLVHWGSP